MAIEDYMTRSVAIQTNTQSADSYGGFSESWATASTVLMAVFPTSAFERDTYARMNVNATDKFFCPASTTVAETQRLYYDSNYYNIIGVRKPGEFTSTETSCAHIVIIAEKVKG